jgi:hypothetical protein
MADGDRIRALAEVDPEAAAKLLLKLQSKIVTPHSGGQMEIMESEARFQVVCCGRRFGKTVIGAKKLLVRCRRPKQMTWWVAPTYKVVKRGYAEVLRQLPDDVLTHVPPQDSAFDAGRSVILRFKNGSRIEFYSAERPEGMLGAGVDFVVLDEAATMAPSVWEAIIRPTLMDYKGSALMISTPRGRNWFYYLWLRGQSDEEPDYASWRFPTASNPYIADFEVEEMRRTLPMLVYEQEVLAEFVSSAGAVFRFGRECVVPQQKPLGHVVVGIDLAKSNDFTVMSAANADSGAPCGFDRFVDVAWAVQKQRIRHFVDRLHKEGATHVTLMIDTGGPGDPIVEDMEAKGYDVIPINFTKFKQHMVTQLSKDLEDGMVMIDEQEPIHEYENYTYTITPAGRWTYSAPEGQHDDVVSAKMLQWWGITQVGVPNITAIKFDEEMDAEDQAEEDDYTDLYDEEDLRDTGIAFIEEVRPNSPREIASRKEAWGS